MRKNYISAYKEFFGTWDPKVYICTRYISQHHTTLVEISLGNSIIVGLAPKEYKIMYYYTIR